MYLVVNFTFLYSEKGESLAKHPDSIKFLSLCKKNLCENSSLIPNTTSRFLRRFMNIYGFVEVWTLQKLCWKQRKTVGKEKAVSVTPILNNFFWPNVKTKKSVVFLQTFLSGFK